jgi:putative transcriptional regulator
MRSNLRNLRNKNKLSVVDMAQKLNISTSFYYKIESGVRNPTISLAKQICNIIQGNMDEIFFALQLDEMSNDSVTDHQETA